MVGTAGRTSLLENIETYVSETTTVVMFATKTNGLASKEERYKEWINAAVIMMECKGKGRVIVRAASHKHRLPNAMYVMVANQRHKGGWYKS